MRKAFTLVEVLVLVLLFTFLIAAFGPQLNRGLPMRSQSAAKEMALGVATAQYQMANRNYVPITTVGIRGIGPGPQGQNSNGVCGWSFGGKNCNAYWYGVIGGLFDIEAADRPLNAYVYPGTVFSAPPIPQRMAPNDPARLKQQADAYRDPSDSVTRERNWPLPTPGISTYNDVGTSYQFSYEWFQYIQGTFAQKMNAGTARIANNQGVNPSRFIWLTDQYASVTLHGNAGSRFVNPYGDENTSVMLFLDGHVGYHKLTPGTSIQRYTTSYYTFIFE